MNKSMIKTITGVLLLSAFLSATEEPKYKVIKEFEDFEIRQYDSYLVAETIVSADFEDAGNSAFSQLFGFISGENYEEESIEMTSPVIQKDLEKKGTKIEMTAPVRQEVSDSGQYIISFVMPERFQLSTIPKPKNESVKIREIPAKKMAVIRYSGTWSIENYEEHKAELFEFLNAEKIKAKGKPVWARYDAPYVPWLFRRNEIMIEIE